jgi:hypothetical protein
MSKTKFLVYLQCYFPGAEFMIKSEKTPNEEIPEKLYLQPIYNVFVSGFDDEKKQKQTFMRI